MKEFSFDIIVVGSGLAGLTAAYFASKRGKVALVTKSQLDTSNSYYAQGGIATVMSDDDNTDLHVHDTMVAGRGICEQDAVEILVSEGILNVNELISLGMNFDKDDNGELVLGLEGGHSKRRILHAGGDATGKQLTCFMLGLVKQQTNVKVFEYASVVSLLVANKQCHGVQVADLHTKETIFLYAKASIMATGGLSRLFSRTTNPNTATGDGIALAYDAGARLEDLEFVQFHPSALAVDGKDAFLISEAVRGEGAWLLNDKGERFMKEIHPLAELAPRDVVAFAIYQQMKKQDSQQVFLSLSHLDADKIKARFSNIHHKLAEYGYDMTKDLLPVAPAAHYMVGGVKTNLNGETNVKGLFACGELASTGVMGANRLASNSLLECLVYGKRAANAASSLATSEKVDFEKHAYNFENSFDAQLLEARNDLASIMSTHIGVVRSGLLLEEGLAKIKKLKEKVQTYDANNFYVHQLLQTIKVSELIATAALLRKESRGGHIREDYSKECADWRLHVVFEKDKDVELLALRK